MPFKAEQMPSNAPPSVAPSAALLIVQGLGLQAAAATEALTALKIVFERVDEEVQVDGGDMIVDARVTLMSGASVLVEVDGPSHFVTDARTGERRGFRARLSRNVS